MDTAEETQTDPGVEQADEQAETPDDNETIVDDDPDQDEGGEEEAPAPEAPPAGPSEQELEKMQGKLERSATTWRNRVSEVLGEMAQALVPCELCEPNIPGFHFPAEVEQPRDNLHGRLLDVLRAPPGPGYLDDPYTQECPTCGGYGKTLTKGRVPGKTERVCPTCKGLGFQSPDTPATAPSVTGNGEVVYDLPNEEPLVSDGTDVWGSPKLLPDGMENPNYGKMPQYKNPTLP